MKSDTTSVLVTGGSRGIGAAAARQLAALGHAIAINYTRDVAAAQALVAQIRAGGGEAIAIQADVADAAQVAAMLARIDHDLPRLASLVNNAGVVDQPARSLGLGACWNAVYSPESQKREDYVREVMDIPRRDRVIANIGVGIPDEKPLPKRVKSLKDAMLKVV